MGPDPHSRRPQAGFEVFDERGELVPVEDVWADPPDINVLPGNEDDPRVVENLLDGVNHTGDDLHAWLAPFTRGPAPPCWITVHSYDDHRYGPALELQ